MKTMIVAGAMVLAAVTGAQAGGFSGAVLDSGVYTGAQAPAVTEAAWVGRYGQLCFHGPVWLPACHATNRPGPYIPGHWNPMRTRFIPGHYA